MDMTPEAISERSLRARLAAHARWANTPDRAAATAAARQANLDRFEKQVADAHPDLDPATVAKLADNAKTAHYTRMALASARARKKAS
ncbi:hypothetical protein [Actinophytocola sp. NPDC049390]|uniref:hypothetical protein n=1 Tax=Actinophytocola sp. NPDC049390 TaxID=3363894 RepID=UPI003791B972